MVVRWEDELAEFMYLSSMSEGESEKQMKISGGLTLPRQGLMMICFPPLTGLISLRRTR